MTSVFINEFHYDNVGTDSGEFIELVAPIGTDLTGWSLVLYNGNGGAPYNTIDLTGQAIANQANGLGTVVIDFPSNGIQNGSPDGVALVDADGAVLEFLSYEGTFTAVGGLADGLTSTDIGVEESSNTPIGQSLQLIDGTWTGPATASKGMVNTSGGGNGGGEFKFIHEVQGDGFVSPLAGQTVTIEGIVVGSFLGDTGLNGFFVQEEDADVDSNPFTSEGIFVFQNGNALSLAEGDQVRVTGAVSEFNELTELTINNSSDVLVMSSGNVLPTAATVNFPVLTADALESFEGMRVTIPDTLFVTEYFNLDRFGEIRLASDGPGNLAGTDGRLEQFTQFNAPDAAGFAAYQDQIATRQIVLDDGSTVQNPETLIFGRGGQPLSATNTLRGGDTVENLTGVLSYGFGDYRIQTQSGVDFQPTNSRPAQPEAVGGSLKVASFNVLNYFTTLDQGGNLTAVGLEPRGANNATEFQRQTDKLVTTLTTLDADVIGLIELENDFLPGSSGNAIEFLVDQLNAVAGAGTYDWVNPGTRFVGDDAIAVGMIYKTAAVTIADGTSVAVLTDADLPGLGLGGLPPVFNGPSTNRAPLAVTFEENATGEQFTLVMNHLKSKGSPGTAGAADQDAGDGAGFANQTRLNGAMALNAWLATDPTGSGDSDLLVMGDLNAYAQEDPVTYLEGTGYTDLAEQFIGDSAYSYLFDGQFGTLDYGLANEALLDQVTGATEWHINADEPDALDYNLDFGRDPSLFDGDIPYRTSDHDPFVVGLNLDSPSQDIDYGIAVDRTSLEEGDSGTTPVVFTISRSGATTVTSSVDLSFGGDAELGVDYTLEAPAGATLSGNTLTFEAGATTATLTANIIGDLAIEPDELLTASLSNPTAPDAATIAVDTASTTILNDDAYNLIQGTNRRDILLGTDGPDQIEGGKRIDIIRGGAGDDLINGGRGIDLMSGGAGRDTFIYTSVNEGIDLIGDFNPAEDTIDISAILADPRYGSTNPFEAYVQLINLGIDNNTTVLVDPNGDRFNFLDRALVVLEGVTPDQLSADNFILA